MKKYVLSFVLFIIIISLYTFCIRQFDTPKELNSYNYFIAANFYNAEQGLEYSLPELEKLIYMLNKNNNVFISFVENGSTDRTKEILSGFELSLQASKKIVICNQTSTSSWKLSHILGESYIKKLFKQRPALRYQKMAVLRNIALAPLKTHTFPNNYKTKVIFLNDVFFTSNQILELISTNSGSYDMVCALDFYYQFYDVLVTRDITGYWFSGYYPYTRHTESLQNLTKGLPIKVKSCWNGIVVFDAEPIQQDKVEFRGRNYDNSTCECVQSECLLFCFDFLSLGKDSIWINPNVKVSYEWKYYMLHQWLGPLVNWFQSWYFELESENSDLSLGIGCSMPPYWEPEVKSEYMNINQEICERNASEHLIYNQNLNWLDYEHNFYSEYYKDFKLKCE